MLLFCLLTRSRDRENSTVFVAELPKDVSEDDLKTLFKDVRYVLKYLASFDLLTVWPSERGQNYATSK